MDNKTLPAHADGCGSAVCAAPIAAPPQPAIASARRFRIATMDCSAEEAEIRRALEPITGIRSLNFHLSARTLGIDAPHEAYPLALDAIRKAGFAPEEIVSPGTIEAQAREGHGEMHDHDHELGGGIGRLVLALGMAIAAEAVGFFAPEGLSWKLAGMALAAIAIWLAGLDVYKKGIAALVRGKLNINALMSVAVTGAFLIG